MDKRILIVAILGLALFSGAVYSYIGGDAGDGTYCPSVQFVDEDGDGVCDNFIDEDGDGICDNIDQKRNCGNCWMNK